MCGEGHNEQDAQARNGGVIDQPLLPWRCGEGTRGLVDESVSETLTSEKTPGSRPREEFWFWKQEPEALESRGGLLYGFPSSIREYISNVVSWRRG